METADLVRLIEEEVARHLHGVSGGVQSLVPVAVSGRHIHLCESDCQTLFGSQPLTKLRDLSQPGEFAARETVTLVGPKGAIEGVRILGPLRKATQVEVSRTDAFRLGVEPPVRDSGNPAGSAGLTVVGPAGTVVLGQGVILALRHIHMTPEDAARMGVADRQIVSVRCPGERALTLGRVLVRVSPKYRLEMHVDTDEANAALLRAGDMLELIAHGER